jgi:hypothetical protein
LVISDLILFSRDKGRHHPLREEPHRGCHLPRVHAGGVHPGDEVGDAELISILLNGLDAGCGISNDEAALAN